MNRKTIWIFAFVLLVVFTIAGVWLYDWVLGETETASAPIQALPVQTEPIQPTETITTTPSKPTATDQPFVEPTETIVPEATANPLTIYSINQSESEVRFTIFEELRGQPFNVIGRTNQVAGEIALDSADLSRITVGTIQVNARTLVTDDDRRNSAIRNRILNTDSFEFITFQPTALTGLSGSVVPGQDYTFQIAGNLTIRDITQPVVFEVIGQLEADGRLRGKASTVIQRANFRLVVPNVPFVANVGEEVLIEIDFSTVAVNP